MNFQQLRIVRETIRQEFNLTVVAETLFTSQSGVSKSIKDLEDELGVEIFVRKGKRLTGLTEPGKEVAVIVEKILVDTASLKKIGQQYSAHDEGQLTIATTHTQARYALTEIILQFMTAFPKVQLTLHQGSPPEIADMVASGAAEIGIATETLSKTPQLATFPFYVWRHGVIVPADHVLTREKEVKLSTLAKFPIITYHEGFTGRSNIDRAFATAGLEPEIVMSAMDTDVLKTYVALGLGVGIIAAMAFDPGRDSKLRLIDVPGLFPENTTWIAVRRGSYLRRYLYRFIELCSPSLTEEVVKRETQSADSARSANM